MSKRNKFFLVMIFLGIGFISFGCGSAKRIESSEIPNKPMSNEAAGAPRAAWTGSGTYIVQKRDCLWTIAGQPGVYGDSFEWPVLFKANRDQIKDPDLIHPRQDLRVEKDISLEESNNAKRLAAATSKYIPHSKPRETLPIDYF